MRKYVVFSILIFCCYGLFARQVNFGPGGALQVSSISHEKTEDLIKFRINSFYTDTINIEGKNYSRIYLPGASIWLEKGYPALPKYARSIIIPDNGVMDFQIVEIECETLKLHQ